MVRLVAALLACGLSLGGCSRVGFEERPDAGLTELGARDVRGEFATDGALDSASSADAGDDLSADAGDDLSADAGFDLLADPLQPFGTPQLIGVGVVSTSAQEDNPTLPSDNAELFFVRQDEPFVSVRVGSQWGPPEKVSEIATTAEETGLEISADGLRLYFGRNTPSGFALFRAIRADRQSAWQAPIELVELGDQGHNVNLTISADQRVALISRKLTGEPYHLWEARRPSVAAAFGKPTPLPALASPKNDLDPWITPDGRRVYFISTRDGSRDIFVSTRATLGAAFSPPAKLPAPINTADDESYPFLSADERTIHFTRGPKGSSNLFRATR
jgi:hypothetical protein